MGGAGGVDRGKKGKISGRCRDVETADRRWNQTERDVHTREGENGKAQERGRDSQLDRVTEGWQWRERDRACAHWTLNMLQR